MPLIYVSAGEASGDARAAEVIEEARKLNPDLKFFGLGGPLMKAQGVELLHDMTQIAHLGLGDVLRNYFQYRKIFYGALKEVESRKPDMIFLVDYPGFNIRFAKKIKKRFPVLYYVSPQIWAWGKRRAFTIARVVNKMLLLFDFERDAYKETDLECEVVGHPLVGKISPSAKASTLKKEFGLDGKKTIVGLLPGSREKEIRRILPIMLNAAALMRAEEKEMEFVLSEATNLPFSLFDEILAEIPLPIKRVRGHSLDVAEVSNMALVTSGTATLETAMLEKPFFILYKTGWTTYHLAKRLIQIPYIGLVNVLAGRTIVPEFLQNDARPATIAHEALFLIRDKEAQKLMTHNLEEVRKKLGKPGASSRAAKALIKFLDAKEVASN